MSYRLLTRLVIGCLIIGGLLAQPAGAAPPPTTRPLAGMDPVNVVHRLRSRTQALNLSDQQKSQIAALFDQAQQQALSLENQIRNLPLQARMQTVRNFVRQLRMRLAAILTPRQFRSLIGQTRPIFQQLRTILPQLNLTADQRKQIDALSSGAAAQIAQIRLNAQAGQNVRGQAMAAAGDFRDRLLDILTLDQQAKFGEITRSQAAPTTLATTAPANDVADSLAPAGVGDDAPQFRLLTSSNADIESVRLRGRVVVMEFGSITCPSFRDHAAAMQHLHELYGGRTFFLLVYTREIHPDGGWEVQRDHDDGIAVPQPSDMRTRRAVADDARQKLHLTIPMVVDTMDDVVAHAYDGSPNATIIIGRDGKIFARQQWTDPSGLPRLIDAALAVKDKPATQPSH